MSKFTDRLWRDLVREHGADLAQMESPSDAVHGRRARSRVLAGTSVGLAAAATAAVLLVGAAASSPAFAVTRNQDGSYSVSVRTWSAIPAANRLLHGMGLRAQVVAVSAGCDSATHASTATPTLSLTRAVSETALIRARLLARQARIDPRHIPAGKMLIIPAWRVGRQVRVMPATAVSAVPECMAPPCAFRMVTVPALASSGTSGSSGAALHASTTHVPAVPISTPRNAQVPVTVRNQLVALAKFAARRCQKAGAGVPLHGIGTSRSSRSSGSS